MVASPDLPLHSILPSYTLSEFETLTNETRPISESQRLLETLPNVKDFNNHFPSIENFDSIFPEVPVSKPGMMNSKLGPPPPPPPMEFSSASEFEPNSHRSSVVPLSNNKSSLQRSPAVRGMSIGRPGKEEGLSTPPSLTRDRGVSEPPPVSPLPRSLALSNFILPDVLWNLIQDSLDIDSPRILLLDLRSRTEFERGHIKFNHIVNLEPIILRNEVLSNRIEQSLVINSLEERKCFSERATYDLIIFL